MLEYETRENEEGFDVWIRNFLNASILRLH